ADCEIVVATQQLGATCRRVSLAIRGSRADGSVRSMASMISKFGDALTKLMDTECQTDDEDQPRAQ
ncbi:hypothetical protein, partial [Paucibacter soli]|uniref:hypothetical protein n=1 Tax=Paucibacter soli TaxID=3133433 RepID=UPI0030B76EC7